MSQPMDVFPPHAAAVRAVRHPLWTVAKRMIDIAGAFMGMLVVAPVLLLLVLTVRLDSPGPALYRQRRVGQHDRPFVLLKLRTMNVDAQESQTEVWSRGERDGWSSKCPDDPRVTRFGAFLRRTSLDELPQLVNVLRGEMSLVGPRPLQAVEVRRLSAEQRHHRHLVKPGITGLWQVSGRSKTTWEERIQLDLLYVDQCSLRADVAILTRTLAAVLRQEGAY